MGGECPESCDMQMRDLVKRSGDVFFVWELRCSVVLGRDEVINKSRKSDTYLVYWEKRFPTWESRQPTRESRSPWKRGGTPLAIGYDHLISNQRDWDNCFTSTSSLELEFEAKP